VNSDSASQEFMEPKGSLQCSQEPANPRSCEIFCNKLNFYSEELLAPCPTTPETVGPPHVGCPRLFSKYIYSYPPYLETAYFNHSLRMCHALATGTHINIFYELHISAIIILPLEEGKSGLLKIFEMCIIFIA
jgi:hypothetical protein